MAEPQPIGEAIEFWIDLEKTDNNGNPIIYSTEPPDTEAGPNWNLFGKDLGVGASGARRYKHVKRVTFDNGEIFDFSDDGKSTYVKTDPQLANKWKAANAAATAPARFAPGGSVEPTDQYYLVWDAQLGGYVQKENPNYNPTMAAKKSALLDAQIEAQQRSGIPRATPYKPGEYEYQLLQNQKMQQEIEGTSPANPYQQWTMGAKWDYDKEQDRIQREQQQAQQALAQRQAAWRAASDVIGQQQQMAPYALRPGQTHFSSYGPGEAWSNLYPWLGLPYNPDSFKVAPVNIDWEKQFRKTQELMGGK